MLKQRMSTLRPRSGPAVFPALLMMLISLVIVQVAGATDTEKKSFTIVYAAEWSPYSYGFGSSVDGILPRLMDRIFDRIEGFELVHNGLPWERAQQVFFHGRADGMVATATEKRLGFARKSAQVALKIPFQPIVRRDSPLKEDILKDPTLRDLSQHHYCDVLGNGWAEEFYAKRGIRFSVAPTIENCLNQLKLGRVDIVVHARPVLEIFRRQLELEEELEILDLAYEESPEFPLMVSNAYPDQTELLERFDRAVVQMKTNGAFEETLSELIEVEKGKPAS